MQGGAYSARRVSRPAPRPAEIHNMTANIMVFDHPYFRVPDGERGFAIENVPAGTHEVSAWHERIGESLSRVQVEPGRTARVECALPVDRRP